jgi:hypothetical protein
VGASGLTAATGIDGVGVSGFKKGDAQGIKTARDAAYNDAMQKLTLKLRAVVRGEVNTSLQVWIKGANAETTEQAVESATSSIFDAVLGRKRFEEYRDEKRREYWVRCWMSQEDADAAIKEAIAAEEKRRVARAVSISLSGSDEGLRALADEEFKRCFSEKGYVVLAGAQAGRARIAVSGEVRTEDLGTVEAVGVTMGRSCRAMLRVEALVAKGSAQERVVAGKAPQDVRIIGRSPAEACEKAVLKSSGEAAERLIDAIERAIAD